MHVPQVNADFVRGRQGVGDTTFTFGVSGILRHSALVMYDRSTYTLWTQEGIAIAGPLKGARLRQVSALKTSWEVWRRLHPDTLVMGPPGRPQPRSSGGKSRGRDF